MRAVELTLVLACILRLSSEWSYDLSAPDGPRDWYQTYPKCGGTADRQSPINIQNWNSQQTTFPAWDFSKYSINPGATFTLINNGHTAELMIENAQFRISGGGLGHTYTLEQLHFHWGSKDDVGSEHELNDNYYPLELHLVHYNSDLYSNVASATGDPSGVAVLAILVQMSTATTSQLKTLTTYFPQILHSGDQVDIDPFEIMTLLPTNTNQFYRYSGSLTTPDCSECVVWTLFYNGLSISDTDMATFRTLFSNIAGHPDVALVDNFRLLQDPAGRIIYKSSA